MKRLDLGNGYELCVVHPENLDYEQTIVESTTPYEVFVRKKVQK